MRTQNLHDAPEPSAGAHTASPSTERVAKALIDAQAPVGRVAIALARAQASRDMAEEASIEDAGESA